MGFFIMGSFGLLRGFDLECAAASPNGCEQRLAPAIS
jgi:hypothetical protein